MIGAPRHAVTPLLEVSTFLDIIFRYSPLDGRGGLAYHCSVQVTDGGADGARASGSSAGRRSVLVVEDNEALRHTILDYAASLGCQAWQAANGLEALWIVKHHRPTLVLLDLTMPRLDGFETSRHIRKFDPSIEIVVVTGDASEATRRRVEDLGLGLLLKPFHLHELDSLFAPR